MDVSIIIPTYNSESYLERAFRSAVSQQGARIEIIIVDNNSTDGTQHLSEQLQAEFPGLVRLSAEKRQGSAAARNHGVRMAKGEWIQFLDSDDILLPGKLQRQLGLADECTDWVIGASISRAMDGSEYSGRLNDDPWKGLVHNGGLGNTNSNLIRRKAYLNVEGQDENLQNGVDTELYFRLLQNDVTVKLDHEPGAVYLERLGDRLSTIDNPVSRARSVVLRVKVRDYLRDERSRYFADNGSFFTAKILSSIRILATKNLEEGVAAYEKYFPGGVAKESIDWQVSSKLVHLYPLLGFRITEQLRLAIASAIPIGLRKFLKGK